LGVFSSLRPLLVLDLWGKRSRPRLSTFDNASRAKRALANFVEAFSADIAHVSARDGREHIAYLSA
jgi:hypothetical protein